MLMANRHEDRKKLCDKLKEAEDKLIDIMLGLDVTETRDLKSFLDWLEDFERVMRVRRELCSW